MIKCDGCNKEYLAIPCIPWCRYCGGWIVIPASEVDLLGEEEEGVE